MRGVPRKPWPARAATTATRFLMLLYPPSFRRQYASAIVDDVGRRASQRSASAGPGRFGVWFIRLIASLIANAAAAWIDVWRGLRRAGPERRGQQIISWLDLKLAIRMLVRYPGLSATGGLGIAVAVAIGVGFFAVMDSRFYPVVPLPDGDRLVGLENRDRRTHQEARRALYDFTVWRASI
jgi:hypothetical protein